MKQKVLARVFLLVAFAFCMQSYAKGGKTKRFAFLLESESGWVQEDSVVKVTYDIEEGCRVNEKGTFYPYVIITVKNKTMKTIYIDLGQCFLIKGEIPCVYYVPGETHTTTGKSAGASVNMGSITGALGIGGVVGTLANGVNVGGGSSSATTNITFAQRVVAVPPMAAKALPTKPLVSYLGPSETISATVRDFGGVIRGAEVVEACSFTSDLCLLLYSSNMQPMKQGERIEYIAENSPVSLHSFVAYSLTEDCSQTVTLSHNCFVRYIVGTKNKIWGANRSYNKKYEEELKQYIPNIEQYKDFFVRKW